MFNYFRVSLQKGENQEQEEGWRDCIFSALLIYLWPPVFVSKGSTILESSPAFRSDRPRGAAGQVRNSILPPSLLSSLARPGTGASN